MTPANESALRAKTEPAPSCVDLKGGNHETAKRGADGAGQVVGGSVQRDGIRDELAGHELGHDSLPGRIIERGADIEQGRKRKQRPGRNVAQEGEHSQQGNGAEHPGLPEDEQLAAVENVCGGASEQAKQQHRKGRRGLHERDEQGGAGERGHQPGASRVLHPGADGGDGRGDPAVAEERDMQRREAGSNGGERKLRRRARCLERKGALRLVYRQVCPLSRVKKRWGVPAGNPVRSRRAS